MFTIVVMLFSGATVASTAEPKTELVSIKVERTSALGGSAANVRTLAAGFLSLPPLAAADSHDARAVLLQKFPLGMKKQELLGILRAVRVRHVCETAIRDIPEVTAGGSHVPAAVEFDVKNYVRVRNFYSDSKIPTEESVAEETFTIAFSMSKSGEIIDLRTWEALQDI